MKLKTNVKTLIAIFISAILLFSFTYFTNKYLEVTSKKMILKVNTIEDYIKKGDIPSAEKVAIDLDKQWDRLEKKWTLLTNHHEIDNITSSVKTTVEFIKFQDIPSSMANLGSLKHYIEHIPNIEKLNLKNIF